jgi:adenylyltransferase/sulfurtransferase
MNRYHRQMLLPSFGPQGQDRLARSRVVVLGCGALGGVMAEQLVRGGIGLLRLIDRDIVEWTNLQRQVLFDETDAREGLPKAMAGARRLGQINSEVQIEPVAADVHAGNAERLILDEKRMPHLVLDGTDNAQTRYLLNDLCVKVGIPWIYGACVGTEGRVMFIEPGRTPCLRCIFPDPPAAGELPTCDTAGVLGSAAAVAASMQSAMAMRHLMGETVPPQLTRFDVWSGRFHTVDLCEARRADCPACGKGEFDFLNARSCDLSARLCGRDAVQLAGSGPVDFERLEQRVGSAGAVQRTRYFLRWEIDGMRLTLFPDGRAIIQGTSDIARARSIYAQHVGV